MRDIEVEFVPAAPTTASLPRVAVQGSGDPTLPIAAFVVPVLLALAVGVPVAAICSLANVGVVGCMVAALTFGALGFAAGLLLASMTCRGRTVRGSGTIPEFH
jgi:hypothetical protein